MKFVTTYGPLLRPLKHTVYYIHHVCSQQTIYMCLIWISEYTEITFQNTISWLVFVIKTQNVSCKRTERIFKCEFQKLLMRGNVCFRMTWKNARTKNVKFYMQISRFLFWTGSYSLWSEIRVYKIKWNLLIKILLTPWRYNFATKWVDKAQSNQDDKRYNLDMQKEHGKKLEKKKINRNARRERLCIYMMWCDERKHHNDRNK
jgi:hypothetical protein